MDTSMNTCSFTTNQFRQNIQSPIYIISSVERLDQSQTHEIYQYVTRKANQSMQVKSSPRSCIRLVWRSVCSFQSRARISDISNDYKESSDSFRVVALYVDFTTGLIKVLCSSWKPLEEQIFSLKPDKCKTETAVVYTVKCSHTKYPQQFPWKKVKLT